MIKITALILSVLLMASPVMADTYYFRATTGPSCGSGTIRNLSGTQGSSATTVSVVSAQSWSWVVAEDGSYATGDWSSITDVTTGAGGGGPNRISATIEHYNSSCSLQRTILATTSSANLTTGGSDADVTITASAFAGFSVSATDEIVVTIARSNGTRTEVVNYDGSTSAADSRLTTPTFTAGGAERRIIYGTP